MSAKSDPSKVDLFSAPVLDMARKQDDKWDREYAAFLTMLPQLLQSHAGKYVAVHEGQLVHTGDEKVELGLRVYKTYGHVPIYVGLVTATPPVFWMPSTRNV